MEYISNDNRKFIFKFEIKNGEKLIITAQEEKKKKIIPDIYKKEFTKDELSNRKKYEIIFDNLDVTLQQIKISFEKGTASFSVDSSEIALSYLLFNNFKVDLVIPSYITIPSVNIDNFSSYFSHSKSFYLHYKKLLKNFTTFFKSTYVKSTKRKNEKFFHILFLT